MDSGSNPVHECTLYMLRRYRLQEHYQQCEKLSTVCCLPRYYLRWPRLDNTTSWGRALAGSDGFHHMFNQSASRPTPEQLTHLERRVLGSFLPALEATPAK